MANTVNDVMNVIASPDYGIKNIAGTNQEILAILNGTHNSKNNIHSIVNDIKNLLQTLVETTTQKKPIEVGNKSAKINRKNIQNILDETKGIRKSIDSLAKILEKQGGKNMPTVAKLSDKASQKVANAMIKDLEKQNKGGGLSTMIDAFKKLKDISLKDIIFGNKKIKKIAKIFKNAKEDLNIKEKDLNAIIKLINAAPEMMMALSKVNWRIDRVIKKDVIKKLSNILVGESSLLTLSQSILDNKKTYEKANKTTKSIKELVLALSKTMKKLFLASIWAKFADGGIKSISIILDKLIPLSQKLSKNEKNIKNGAKVASKLTILIGNILATSIFLSATALIGIPAILGAMVVSVLVDSLTSIAKKMSKNDKRITKAIGASISFVVFTGFMALASLALTSIASNGIPALLGSLVILGVVSVNVISFKILSKFKKDILIGSVMMAIMSVSLLLFGIALGKITKATENVTFKQIAVIVSMTLLLGGAVALLGIPAVSAFIILGSISMAVMSIGLLVFGSALGKLSKATEKLKFSQTLLISGSILALGLAVSIAGLLSAPIMFGSIALVALSFALNPFLKSLHTISKTTEKLQMKDIGLVASSMGVLGLAVAGMAILTIPIGLGAVALGAMGSTLYQFVKSLKMISDMGTIPEKEVNTVINVMKTVGNFFKKNALKFKAVRSAKKYQQIMKPFGKAIQHLTKLKKLGNSIPLDLVYQSLDAMQKIGIYFKENDIDNSTIKAAKRYKKMLRPFGKAVGFLSKLKEIGNIPIDLVHGTLDIMKVISNYYINNPIERKAIKSARKYKKIMRPFGKTIGFLSKLKEIGNIPMNLVYGALDIMKVISNYYIDNPVERKAIKSARKYKKIMRPFGKTIGFLSKLKEMGSIPMELVQQALSAMSVVVKYYTKQDLTGRKGRKAKKSANIISKIVSSFGVAVGALKTLSELKSLPTSAVRKTLSAIDSIAWFYQNSDFNGGDIQIKSEFIKIAVDKFTDMTKEIQDKFTDIKEVDHRSVSSIVKACRSIVNFYTRTHFFVRPKKVAKMNAAIISFAKNAKQFKESIGDYSIREYKSVILIIKSMKKILGFLKKSSLNKTQIIKAKSNISLLSGMADALMNINKVNPSDLISVGDSLTNALGGIQSIDMSQVQAVTNMFNAFKDINKSENVINKFAENVKNFTEACKDLKEAMYSNTDALNNIDTSRESQGDNSIWDKLKNKVGGFIGGNENNYITPNQNDGIRIANVDELAKTIAEKINGSLYVDIPDTQVQLLINGTGGNEWTISRY